MNTGAAIPGPDPLLQACVAAIRATDALDEATVVCERVGEPERARAFRALAHACATYRAEIAGDQRQQATLREHGGGAQ